MIGDTILGLPNGAIRNPDVSCAGGRPRAQGSLGRAYLVEYSNTGIESAGFSRITGDEKDV